MNSEPKHKRIDSRALFAPAFDAMVAFSVSEKRYMEGDMLVRMKCNGLVIWRRRCFIDRSGFLLDCVDGVDSADWPKECNWTLSHIFLLKYLEGIRCRQL